MALTGKTNERQEGGEQKKFFVAEFSNGTIDQLKDLANYLEKEGFDMSKEEDKRLREVVRIGISWLEAIKNKSQKKEELK